MVRKRKQFVALAASAVVAVGLAGCGGGDDGGSGGSGGSASGGETTQGGTLNYLVASVIEHLDPQRVYVGRDISNLGRTVYRSWVTFPINAEDDTEANTPIPDLATDTGTANEDATEWSFTLKDGPVWQDGEPITCEDFKYGVSRTFAQDVITGGPNYIIGYLDIPTDNDGSPAYKGPYSGEGQDLFDQAVTCDGNTITYRFKKPWADFPLAIASLRAFDPYREDIDNGDQNDLVIFSNGPYMLDGEWDENTGGTLVRNPEWDAEEDTNREANPDSIVFSIGDEPEVIIERLIADSGDDQTAVSATSITPGQYQQIQGPVEDRATLTESPFTNYLLPNFNQIDNVDVRRALLMATDREAYIAALGGENAGVPATTIVNPNVPGYVERDEDVVGPAGGDPEAAAQILEDAGVQTPYPIKFTYPIGSEASNAAFAALRDTYQQAGFDVTLDGLDPSGPYYETVQAPDSDSDLIWGGWGADWPSISTVIPPLFDSRINLTANSNGQDYGNYDSDQANEMIDEGLAEPDLDAANEIWSSLDEFLLDDVAYIPLNTTNFYYLHGSQVADYDNAAATSGYPDLGIISIAGGGS